jgi:hypothetical protein
VLELERLAGLLEPSCKVVVGLAEVHRKADERLALCARRFGHVGELDLLIVELALERDDRSP